MYSFNNMIKIIFNMKICLHMLLAITILGICSCATIRANIFIIENTTPQEKAEILYREADRIFESDIKIYSDYKKISKSMELYNDALKINPELKEIPTRTSELVNYSKQVFNRKISKAIELSKIPNRTKEQDFDFFLAVKQASDINLKHSELTRLKKEAKVLEYIVKERQIINIRALEPRVLESSDHRDLLNLIKRINDYILNLEKLDPFNQIALESKNKIGMHVVSMASLDMDSSLQSIKNKDFILAEQHLNRAIEKFTVIDVDGTEKISEVKYSLYYNWGRELLRLGKYQSARISGELARSIKRTDESQKLLNDITAITSQRNFESTIDDVLESIDFYISKNDLVMAKKIIDINIPKFKRADNKKKLSNMEVLINTRIDKLYSEGVSLYNDEDYKSAIEKFEIVIEYNKNYRDIKAYFDKTEIKVKALYGG